MVAIKEHSILIEEGKQSKKAKVKKILFRRSNTVAFLSRSECFTFLFHAEMEANRLLFFFGSIL